MRTGLLLLALACCAALPIRAQELFQPVEAQPNTRELVLPENLKGQVLFRKSDDVVAPDGKPAPAKGKFDFMTYLPLDETGARGYLWVNHETKGSDDRLGDGGGATVLEIEFADGEWRRGAKPRAVDFAPVGGTWNNCLGGTTPWGTVLTSEEYEPADNKEIFEAGVRDTSDFGGYPRYLNYGWMVETDPATGKVLGKRWQMGRFSHEVALCLDDEQTVYMTDDYAPGVFFKFIADKRGSYETGKLYAFKQLPEGGKWLEMPRDRDSLNFARDVALKKGATIFFRIEDFVELPDGRILISETGNDSIHLTRAFLLGGELAPHLTKCNQGDGVYSDKYGRLLIFDPKTNELEVFLEGGKGRRTGQHLANPDNLSFMKSATTLIIHEDINDITDGRVPEGHNTGTYFNELFALDLSIKHPTVDDLKRMACIPAGAESTGSCWTPDDRTIFVNIQHPDKNNPEPWNKDCTVAITGFGMEEK